MSSPSALLRATASTGWRSSGSSPPWTEDDAVETRTSRLERMPRADAARIAWFLDLQRILHFPRISVAPLIFSRSRRRPTTCRSETTNGGAWTARPEAATASGIRHLVLGESAGRKRAKASIRGTDAATSPRFITRIMTERLGAAKTLPQAWLKPASTSARDGSLERYIAVTPAARRVALGAHERYPAMMNFLAASPGSLKLTALAPSFGLSVLEHPKEPKGNPARSLAMPRSGELLQRQRLLSTEERFLQKRHVADDQKRVSPDRDTTAASARQPNKPAVSTIHIDGSALGRWTVQHLERALSKPVTGMTGIDPRAAVPRSRVAPF